MSSVSSVSSCLCGALTQHGEAEPDVDRCLVHSLCPFCLSAMSKLSGPCLVLVRLILSMMVIL